MPPLRPEDDPFADYADPVMSAPVAPDPFADYGEPEGPGLLARVGQAANAAATGVVSGATFGLNDELRGLVRGGARALGGEDFAKARAQETEIARAGEKALRERNPVASIAGQVAGGVAVPIPGLGAARTLGGAAVRGAGAGAVSGGATGFGEAEGGLASRAGAAVSGGALGAAGGALLGPAVKYGADKARALFTKAGAEEQGQQVLAEALRSEKLSPDEIAREIARRNAAGVTGVTLPDVAQSGPAMAALKDAAQNPNRGQGPLRESIIRRQMGQTGDLGEQIGGQVTRVVGALDEAAKTGGDRWYQQAQKLAGARKAAAGPAFRAAEAVDVTDDPGVRAAFGRVADSDIGAGAVNTARRLWANQYGKSTPFPLDDPRNLSAVPNMRVLKIMKEALDDEVTRLFANEKTQNLGRSGAAIRDEFREALKAANPQYAAAMQQYAGDKAMEEALDAGRKYFTGDPGEQMAVFKTLSPAEQEQFRIGAINSLANQVKAKRSGPSVDLTAELRTPGMRERVAAILPDDNARQQFFVKLEGEQGFSSTANAIQGSQTTPLAEAAKNVEAGALPGPRKLPANISIVGLAQLALEGANERFNRRRFSQRRGKIAEDLMRTDGDAVRLMKELMDPARTAGRPTGLLLPRAGGVAAGEAGAGLFPGDEPRRPGLF